MRLLVLALCLPLGGCYLSRAVWAGAGGHAVVDDLVATYAADTIDRDGEVFTVHAVQTGGEVAEDAAELCRGEVWIRLTPTADAEALASALACPEAFAVQTAALTIDAADGKLLGGDANGHFTATVRALPSALGEVVSAPAATAALPPIDDRMLALAAGDCAADLAAADWSLFEAIAPGASVLSTTWTAADGRRLQTPAPDRGAPLDAAMFDAALKLPSWSSRRAALAGMGVELQCKSRSGEPVCLRLDPGRAWTYALLQRAAGGIAAANLRTQWVAELERSPATARAPQAIGFPLQVAVHSRRERWVAGSTFGETMLRILATPFAVAGDLATGVLVAVVDALLNDDDDEPPGGRK